MSFGLKRGRGQPRQDGYDLQLMLHVDVGTAVTGMSVNKFTAKHPFAVAGRGPTAKATVRRRYYERRRQFAPIVRPGVRLESPSVAAYEKLLGEILKSLNAAK